jgi:hypothetical protein
MCRRYDFLSIYVNPCYHPGNSGHTRARFRHRNVSIIVRNKTGRANWTPYIINYQLLCACTWSYRTHDHFTRAASTAQEIETYNITVIIIAAGRPRGVIPTTVRTTNAIKNNNIIVSSIYVTMCNLVQTKFWYGQVCTRLCKYAQVIVTTIVAKIAIHLRPMRVS